MIAAKHAWESGYTMIEIMVAIAIVAMCVTLTMPSVERAKTNAQKAACASNLRQIGQASLLYHADRQSILPWYTYADGYWWQALVPYGCSDTRIFHCSSDKGFLSDAVDRTISYGWNYKLTGHGDSGANPNDFLRIQGYSRPSQVLIASDGPGGAVDGQEDCWGYIDERAVHEADPSRHAKQGNALFLDGHVESLPATQFVDPFYYDRTLNQQ